MDEHLLSTNYEERCTSDKPYKTIDEQIAILKDERNLKIEDINYARHFLNRHSYYDLVNGYKDFFIDKNCDKETFLESASFNSLVALYKFDRNLRNVVLAAVSDAESVLRCALALTVGECYGELQDNYLDVCNFRPGRTLKRTSTEIITQRTVLLDSMNDIINSNEQPMRHYREDHHNVPPWILVEGMSLGNLCMYYELSHKNVKEKMIARATNINLEEIDDVDKEFFRKSLDVLRKFRNRAAHGGIIYNYNCKDGLIYRSDMHEIVGINKDDFINQNKGKNDFLAFVLTLINIYRGDPDAFKDNFIIYFSIYLDEYEKQDPNTFKLIMDKLSMDQDYIMLLMGLVRNT